MSEPIPDPARWLALVVAVFTVVLTALDATILLVSTPTITRELGTTLPAVQWVFSGYALTFATLLIIGGRLADMFGTRRILVVGFTCFGIGSALASLAPSVGVLILGQAVIKGVGASLLLPASMSVISNLFHGRERATAFAAWGAAAAIGSSSGPVVGGLFTTYLSWRWAFRSQVVLSLLCVLGALIALRPTPRRGGGLRLDVPGAVLIAVAMFLVVFGLGQGPVYGWWTPRHPLIVLDQHLWPSTRPVSIAPTAVVLAIVALAAFTVIEGRPHRDGLFDLSLLRLRSYRNGLVACLFLAMGQMGFALVFAVFLQNGRHLSAATNGIWTLPMGFSAFGASYVGARLTHRLGPTRVVQFGTALYALAMTVFLFSVQPGVAFLALVPAMVLAGFGTNIATPQLTNLVMSEIPPDRSGVAAGAQGTLRQIGSALGVSVLSATVAAQSLAHAARRVSDTNLPDAVQQQVLATIDRGGMGASLPSTLSEAHTSVAQDALDQATAAGVRAALVLIVVVTTTAFLLTLRLPRQPAVVPA